MKAVLIACILGLLSSAFADTYMHNPRGNNDRCDEQSNDRQTPTRLFNSQNNAAGGYCINTESMYFYMGSVLQVEWTAQHACGSDGKVHCNYILQFACEDTLTIDAITEGPVRDGRPAANPENGNQNDCTTQIDPNAPSAANRGRNEPLNFYTKCGTRERNKGLLTLDQNLQGNDAQFTRQNAGGTEYGFECQEERDYYPYWQPTPWRDIAILTTRPELCETIYKVESQNVKPRFECDKPQFNNKDACVSGTGLWVEVPSFNMAAPECIMAPWSRDNHLGSSNDGFLSSYNWTIPYLTAADGSELQTCVLRLRYNISTGDYDDWNAFVTDNAKLKAQENPVKSDPAVQIATTADINGNTPFEVQLAVDTSQFGRTFQDRSYVWKLAKRPVSIDKKDKIYNLNVRGKRGNIAQVRNCVEYDFVPNIIHVSQNDYVHFQWTGCDRNPAGNDGEGTQRTDRSNVCQMENWESSFPLPLEDQQMFDSYELALQACLLNQTNCVKVTTLQQTQGNGNAEQSRQNCAKLNAINKPFNATSNIPNNGDQTTTGISYTAYFDLGAIKFNKTGSYHYMGTRNNNFSNRGQKALLVVEEQLSAAAIAGIAVGAAAGVALLAVGGLMIAGRMMPDSWAASVLVRFGLA